MRNRKPGAVSRPGAIPEFQFQKYADLLKGVNYFDNTTTFLLAASVAVFRLFEHPLKRQARLLISQLDVFSRKPDLETSAAEFPASIETKQVPFHPPFSRGLVAHFIGDQNTTALIQIVPVDFIGQFHAGELRLNLRSGQLLEIFCRQRARSSCQNSPRT